MRTVSCGAFNCELSARATRRIIRHHLSILHELLASFGGTGSTVTGFTLGSYVFAFPRPWGVPSTRTLFSLRLRGQVHREGAGARFCWRIVRSRISIMTDYQCTEMQLLEEWLQLLGDKLNSVDPPPESSFSE